MSLIRASKAPSGGAGRQTNSASEISALKNSFSDSSCESIVRGIRVTPGPRSSYRAFPNVVGTNPLSPMSLPTALSVTSPPCDDITGRTRARRQRISSLPPV